MTTPKPKARKAACVWVVEYRLIPFAHWEWLVVRNTKRAAISRAAVMRKGNRKDYVFRVSKYQRIDK